MKSFQNVKTLEEVKQDFSDEKLWGLLTSVDLYGCNGDIIKSKEAINEFTVKLCDMIEVKRFGEAKIVKFGEDPKVTGYSLVQLIETSLVSGHFADNTDAAYLDIFSCKAYDIEIVLNFSKEFFEAERIEYSVTYRS